MKRILLIEDDRPDNLGEDAAGSSRFWIYLESSRWRGKYKKGWRRKAGSEQKL